MYALRRLKSAGTAVAAAVLLMSACGGGGGNAPAAGGNPGPGTPDLPAILTALEKTSPTYADIKSVPMGATWNYQDSKTLFIIYAKEADDVDLCVYNSASDSYSSPDRSVQMTKTASGAWYVLTDQVDLTEYKFYRFKLSKNGLPLPRYDGGKVTDSTIGDNAHPENQYVPDLYARASLGPNGHSILIDPSRTSVADATAWAKASWTTPDAQNMIIYEVHVGDFTKNAATIPDLAGGSITIDVSRRGKYTGFIEALPYLKNLGITCIELMPVHEYCNDTTALDDYSWGYLPALFFSPESKYASNYDYNPASPTAGATYDGSAYYELRRLIDEAHKLGMAVILDVVLTHTSNKVNVPFWMSPNDRYFFHLNGTAWASCGTGNWIADGERYDSTWSSASDPGRPFAKKLVLDNLRYWVDEFNVDGFRFDLGVATGTSTYTLAVAELEARNPKIFMTIENWIGGSRHGLGGGWDFVGFNSSQITNSKKLFIGQWNDAFRKSIGELVVAGHDSTLLGRIQAAIYFSKDLNDISGFNRADNPVDTVNYLESHDEETIASKTSGSIIKSTIGATVLSTTMGVPMFYEGQEFNRSKAHQDQTEASNTLDWSLATSNSQMLNFVKTVLNLRKNNSQFKPLADPSGGYVTNITGTDTANRKVGYMLGDKYVVLVNTSGVSTTFTLPTGTWKCLGQAQSGNATGDNTTTTFPDVSGWGTSTTNWGVSEYCVTILEKQ